MKTKQIFKHQVDELHTLVSFSPSPCGRTFLAWPQGFFVLDTGASSHCLAHSTGTMHHAKARGLACLLRGCGFFMHIWDLVAKCIQTSWVLASNTTNQLNFSRIFFGSQSLHWKYPGDSNLHQINLTLRHFCRLLAKDSESPARLA